MVSGCGKKVKKMTTCETKNDNESMPTEMMAVEPKQEPKLEAKKEKM